MTAIALLLLLGTASAAPEVTPEDDARAQELFQEGDAHYAAGRYELAAQRFQEAYDLCGRPALLFNLANVYERLSQYETSADYLRRYLDSGAARDIVSVRARLQRLELAIAQEAASPPTPAPAPVQVVAASPPVEVPPPVSRPPTWPTVALAAGAGVATASAVTFGLLTQQQRTSLGGSCALGPEGETVCRPDAERALGSEAGFALASDVSAAVAVATGSAAVVHAVLRRASVRRASVQVSLVPRADLTGGWLVVAADGARRQP
ncbi:MAG: hypothetical protein R3F59_25735 [Myxococcota bacterium]